MTYLNDLLDNRAVFLPILSWVTAQVFKFVLYAITKRTVDFRKLVTSGGMPSSHSAITVCLAAVMAMDYGFGSAAFAMATIFSLVVMADATGVRRAAGKQAEVLNKLINHTGVVRLDKELKELLGHTPVQVFAGAVLGIAIAAVFR